MTGGNVAYLLLVVGSFLAFSGALFYASTQTLEAEADPNIPTGKTNPNARPNDGTPWLDKSGFSA